MGVREEDISFGLRADRGANTVARTKGVNEGTEAYMASSASYEDKTGSRDLCHWPPLGVE